MANDHDPGVTAVSALVGGVATIVQELVATGAVEPDRLRKRLIAFAKQDSVQLSSPRDRELIERVIGTLTDAIESAAKKKDGNVQ